MTSPWTQERTDQLLALVADDVPQAEISVIMGVSINAIAQKLHVIRLKALGRQHIPRERERALQQASEAAIAALYAGRRYDDVKLKPSTQQARIWPHKHMQGSLSGCGLDMLSYSSGKRAGGATRSAG